MKSALLFLLISISLAGYGQGSIREFIIALDTSLAKEQKIKLIAEGLALRDKEHNDSLWAEFYLRAGITYGIFGDADTAIYYLEKSLETSTYGQHLLQARCYNGLGNVNRQTIGNSKVALEYFLKALSLLDGKEDQGSKEYVGSAISNIAGIYFGIGDLDKSELYTLKGLEYARAARDSAQMAYGYVGLGMIYNKQEKYDQALECYNKATALIEKRDIAFLRDYNKINLAKVYENKGEHLKAIMLYDEILAGNNPDTEARTLCLENAARLSFVLNDYDRAIGYANKLLAISNNHGILPTAVESNRLLSKAYQEMGEYRKANIHLNEYVTLNDSLINSESLKALSELETKYASEKKEREITKLKLKNQNSENQRNIFFLIGCLVILGIIFLIVLLRSKSKTNTIILNSLSEKEILLKEIHHRVKNNLQIISSLLSLQSKSISDETAVQAVNAGKNRVKSMALIHQTLYQKDNLTGIKMESYVQNLVESLFTSYGISHNQIIFTSDITSIRLDVDTAIPLGLILNELVSNALKHAFGNNKGELYIQLRKEENILALLVKDDGKGFKKETDSIQEGFGLRLIESLARKLKATISFDSSAGTSYLVKVSKFKIV